MILNDEQYKKVWNRVYNELKFYPKCADRNSKTIIPPFVINKAFVVYGIENTSYNETEKMDLLISKALIKCTKPGERIYALDWQHASFLYDPRKADEQQSIFVSDKRYLGGGYNVYFPNYYPNGDYHFFISEDFRFGYLSHPWRKEVWVFGDELIEEFEEFYKSIGWIKLK